MCRVSVEPAGGSRYFPCGNPDCERRTRRGVSKASSSTKSVVAPTVKSPSILASFLHDQGHSPLNSLWAQLTHRAERDIVTTHSQQKARESSERRPASVRAVAEHDRVRPLSATVTSHMPATAATNRQHLPTPPTSMHSGRGSEDGAMDPSDAQTFCPHPTRFSTNTTSSKPRTSLAALDHTPQTHHHLHRHHHHDAQSERTARLLQIQAQTIQSHRQVFFARALGPPGTGRPAVYQSQQSKLQEAINALTPAQKVLLFPEQCGIPRAFSERYVCTEELGSGGCGFAVVARRLSDWTPVCVKFIYKNRVSSHSWVLDTLSPSPPKPSSDDHSDTESVSTNDSVSSDDDMDVDDRARSSRGRGKGKGRHEPTSVPSPAEVKKVAVPLETYLLRNMKHENIVGFMDVWEDARHFILVMELHGCPWDDSSKHRVPTCHGLDPLQAASLIRAASVHVHPSTASHSILTSGPPLATAPTQTSSLPTTCPCLIPPSLALPPPAPTTVVPKHPPTDLFECVEKLGVLTECQARYIFRQVVEAVWYLHVVCGVVHRDIKDENLVVSHTLHVKLIDLGNSAFIPAKDRPDLFFDRFYGTVQYCAPEVLCGKRYRGPEAEMWSLGVLLYTLLFSELPFADPSQTVHLRYARPRYQRTPAVIALLDRLLEKDPVKRATVEEVRQCSWWNEIL